MKRIYFGLKVHSMIVFLSFFLFSEVAYSQVLEVPDTLNKVQPDTLKAPELEPVVVPVVVPAGVPTETPQEVPTDTPEAKPEEMQKQDVQEADKQKDKKGKKNEIVFYAGANFTQLGASDLYETQNEVGYQLGAYYKQGRLVYWQVGARYASAKIGYKPADSPASEEFGSFTVSDLDFPLTLGLNFTSFMNRVLSVRLFASAVPAITLNVGDNTYGIDKDNVESFVMYGQGGIGVNVAFLVLEAGYNFGFNELLVGNTDSKPGQVFINLGFRF